jgi:hypothetical protein
MPYKRGVQPDNNKQLRDPILRIGLYIANRVDLPDGRRVLALLLPVLAPVTQPTLKEKAHVKRPQITQLRVPKW